jgi:hypothetical protein
MVIANRCMLCEEGLLKLKSQLSEATEANQSLTTIANELTQERDHVANELALLKVDMAARDADLKKALDKNKWVADQMKMLTNQMEMIKISAVEEFKLSEAYDDNNTKYFLAGFKLLRKQAKEKCPDIDFDVFQPYEDDDSAVPVEEGNDGGTSVDPQLDDDATTSIYLFYKTICVFLWGPFWRPCSFWVV